METELSEQFRKRNNVPEVRKILYDYIFVGSFDVCYYLGKKIRKRNFRSNLPITCAHWHPFFIPYSYSSFDRLDFKVTGERVIFLNVDLSPLLHLRLLQALGSAASVDFYVMSGDGYDVKRAKA